MLTDPAPSIKMFGLQRTCTKVVLKGVKANYFVTSRERGREWKHGQIGLSGDDVPIIVCCFRNPLARLTSMYRWSHSGDRHGCPHFRRGWSFAEFLSRPHYDWPTPLERWNALNLHYLEWIQTHPERGLAVRSEDMMSLEDARRQYLRIGVHFALRPQSDCVHVFDRRVNCSQELLTDAMEFDYYRQRRYLTDYSSEARAEISRQADPWVLRQLAYTDLL